MLEKSFLTQRELAERFRVSEGTIINWRKEGHLPYFRIPGSRNVLYPIEGILEVEQQFLTSAKEAIKKQRKTEVKRKKPVISTTDKEWRI